MENVKPKTGLMADGGWSNTNAIFALDSRGNPIIVSVGIFVPSAMVSVTGLFWYRNGVL